MTDQPYTPTIEDIIIAYHTYVTEDGTYSQEFEVSRDEVDRALAAARIEGLRLAQQIISGDLPVNESRDRHDMVNAGYLIRELDEEIRDQTLGEQDDD